MSFTLLPTIKFGVITSYVQQNLIRPSGTSSFKLFDFVERTDSTDLSAFKLQKEPFSNIVAVMTNIDLIISCMGGSGILVASLGFLFKYLIDRSTNRAIAEEKLDSDKKLQTQRADFEHKLALVEAELKTVNAKAEFKHSTIFPDTKTTLQGLVARWVALHRLLIELSATLDKDAFLGFRKEIEREMADLIAFGVKNQIYIPEFLDTCVFKMTGLLDAKFEQIKIRYAHVTAGDKDFIKDTRKTLADTNAHLETEYANVLRQFRKQLGVLVEEHNRK